MPPLPVERRLLADRLPAAHRYVRANGLDRVSFGARRPRVGIVTAGKAYGDVRQALEDLGIGPVEAEEVGLAVYKLAMTWPVEPEGLRDFAEGVETLLVVEEKRPLIEEQLASILYASPERPALLGKRDAAGAPLLPSDGELDPAAVAEALTTVFGLGERRHGRTVIPLGGASQLVRRPAFCAGCPHNTSTVVPEGSFALSGIGCHGMATWLPERHTLAYTHMGGEGANWIGASPFTETSHVFQNLGDGTYTHSGSLAIRAAVAAGVDITYKILVNGAVAMTGGQAVEGHAALDGLDLVHSITRQLDAEGVRRVVVLSDAPERYRSLRLPASVAVHHRDHLDRVQRELRDTPGVTAIVYDQVCAAEARRLRKRGQLVEPSRRVIINELVCEGCGDCGVQSNCIAIEPVETDFGRKRRINQDACNKDYSCLHGYVFR